MRKLGDMMNVASSSRRFAVWLMALFVSAQLLGTAHAAAFGKQDHLHDGHPCIVASFVKKSADFDLKDGPALVEPVETVGDHSVGLLQTFTTTAIDFASARAPPLA